jgi:TDG/mug DNA glycosylase family protein
MTNIRGFPPISRPDARTLILGSMPSRESLAQQRYYAHSRNGFWPIVSSLFAFTDNGYQHNADQLTQNGVAVWDVLKTCFRTGSLDSDIDDSTIVTNDFQQFFAHHPDISRVFFNGAKAESVYLKHVLPKLDGAAAKLKLQRLPSTSPAHASISFEQKKDAWRVIMVRIQR